MSTQETQQFHIPMDDPTDEAALILETAEGETGTPPTGDIPETIQPAPLPSFARRVFKYATHSIPDPGMQIEIEDVRRALIPYFPDLVQATHTQRVEGDTLIVTFQKQATRKGAGHRSCPPPDPLGIELARAIRKLPRFRDALSALHLPKNVTLADLAAQRVDILEALDADRAVPHLVQRMVTQCLALPPSPLQSAIPSGF